VIRHFPLLPTFDSKGVHACVRLIPNPVALGPGDGDQMGGSERWLVLEAFFGVLLDISLDEPYSQPLTIAPDGERLKRL
jgi:hypothetical protein